MVAEVGGGGVWLRELVVQLPIAVAVTRGPDHVGKQVNERALELIGRRDPTGRPLREVFPELAGQGLLELLDRVYATGEPFVAAELPIAPEGETGGRGEAGSYQVRIQPIRGEQGEVEGLILLAIDVTEQVRARQRAVEAASERTAFLAEASAVLAGSLDYAATLASIARLTVPYLADWCNVDVLEADGLIHRLATVHADPAKQELADRLQRRYPRLALDDRHTLLEVFRTGRSWIDPAVSRERLVAQSRDAEHLELIQGLGFASEMVVPLVARERVLGTITLVRTDPGRGYTAEDLALAEELARRVALALDNARLHREVRQQMETEIQLNATLRETAAARDRAVVELERALRTRDDFLAAAAHDLKSPLTNIKGQAQLLRRRATRAGLPMEDTWVQGMARIDLSVTKMTAMVDELLDLTRLQFGEALPLDRAPVELIGLVGQVAAERQTTTDRHRLRVETSLPELVGEWDAVRLERMLLNLLDNAIKYSPGGGEVLVTVGAEDAPSGGWAVVAVRDWGLGIPAADLPRLFERFHRAENVLGRIGGTGIGLALVRHTVESHGGTISVESREGLGSTFTIRLPLANGDTPKDS